MRPFGGAIVVAALVLAAGASATTSSGRIVALVTAEHENRLLAVDVSSGKLVRQVSLPADPENVATWSGSAHTAVVVSAAAGAVTLLDLPTFRKLKVLRGFASPHVAAISPFGKWAYVTDSGRGELSVIALGTRRLVSRLFVGRGAHHLTLSAVGQRAWIALGERARQVAIVDISRPAQPRLIRRFTPGFEVHEVKFTRDERRVWATSATGDSIYVLDARSGRTLRRIRVGAGPQHVVFESGVAYVTSGYAGRIVLMDSGTYDVLERGVTPRGSFHLATFGERVATTSLLTGETTVFDSELRRLRTFRVAGSTRSVALTVAPAL